MTRATHCRFCHQPGELIKGAHKECKNAETRERLRVRNGINPANYLYIGDRGKCKRCDNPAEPLSKLNLCRQHMEENAREVIRKAKRKHMKKVRSSPEPKQPRLCSVCQKPFSPQDSRSTMHRLCALDAAKKEHDSKFSGVFREPAKKPGPKPRVEPLPEKILDTPAEKNRVAELLEKARRERVTLEFSRWS